MLCSNRIANLWEATLSLRTTLEINNFGVKHQPSTKRCKFIWFSTCVLVRFHHSRQYFRYTHRYRWKHFPKRVKTPLAKSVQTAVTFWLILLNPPSASITCHPFYSHQHTCRTHSNKVSFRLLRCRRVLDFVFCWPCWTHKIKSFANVCIIIPYRNLCSLR